MGRNLGPLNIKDSYEGLVQISGSQLTDGSGSLISSLDVTASYASNAGTSGYAGTAGFATSASFADQSGTSGFATSASFATTASYALNVTPIDTGSLMVTGSVTDATLTFTKGDGSTFPLTVNNVANATSALLAVSASHAVNADNAITAQTASFLPSDTNLNINSITASFASFTSASIGYLQTVTGSATIIGDAFIILNNDTPTQRYAGIVVQDSGSTAATASLFFDGVTNDWNYEYTSSGDPDNFGVVMFGPEYGTKGSPIYPTANTLQKGNGGHHILDSNIIDDGTLVTINSDVSASGYVSASTYYGDGSNLSGISSDPFPYTGSAIITGSLDVIGNVILGESDNTITSTGTFNTIAGGTGNTIEGTADKGFVTGESNTLGSSVEGAILGGSSNSISGGTRNSVVIGSISSGVTGASGLRQAGIYSSRESTITGGSFYGQAIIASWNSTLNGSLSVIAGGQSQTNSGAYGFIGGGTSHTISSGTDRNAIVGGQQNTMSAGDASGILGGYLNETTATTTAIVGGRSNTAGHQDSVVLGGDGLSTTKTQEAVVEHLSIYGDTFISSSVLGTGSLIDNLGQEAIVTGSQVQHIVNLSQAEYDALTPDANTLYVIDGAETLGDTVISGSLIGEVGVLTDAAGTTTLDCSTGNYFTLAMPAGGTTALTPTNIQIGQTINIKITQNATASTLTYAASIDFPGGTAFTISTGSGEVDILTLVSFDGTSLQATGLANFS